MSDIETGRDSMKYLKKVIILQILFVVIIGAVNVQAAYNKCPTGRYIPYKTKIIKVDLNKEIPATITIPHAGEDSCKKNRC